LIYRFADCDLDTARFELRRAGVLQPLEPQVFDVLRYLVEHRERLVTKDELLEKVWEGRFVSEAALSSRMKAVRQAIGDSGSAQSLIRTTRGRGFRFVGGVREVAGAEGVIPRQEPDAASPAASRLLERSAEIESLQRLFRSIAAEGEGRVALIHGEAGIGKSSLLTAFLEAQESVTSCFTGFCDAVMTPRPLGPLQDIARAAGPPLAKLITAGGDREAILIGLIDFVRSSSAPPVLAIEDLHWGDEATLDLLISLVRRLSGIPLLLIGTYRSDEVGRVHPLRRLLGSLSPRTTTRLGLEPLSLAAVETLMGAGKVDALRLHSVTAGNPFFVTEVLAAGEETLPLTISDAVLARMRRSSPAARELIELVSASPRGLDFASVASILQSSNSALDEALESGVLKNDAQVLHFRHELARLAVLESLPFSRRIQMHRALLDHLLRDDGDPGEDLPMAVHHATVAREGKVVVRLAPRAAALASALGAHLEAAAHYQAALEYENLLGPRELADLLEGLSFELYLARDIEEALRARERALALRSRAGDDLARGRNLRWMSRLHWFAGRNREAHHFAASAVETLEPLEPGSDLAMAYSNRSQLKMLGADLDGALRWGERAIELATRLGDQEVLAHALTNVGLARLAALDGGEDVLRRALEITLKENMQEHAARAYTALTTGSIAIRRYADAERWLREGTGYCEAHDLDNWTAYLDAWAARWELESGSWDRVADLALRALSGDAAPAITRISAGVPLALLRLRRGEAGSGQLLDELLELADTTGELQRIAPVATARGEAAWLEGNLDGVRREVRPAFELAKRKARAWELEHLAWWLWVSGETIDLRDPRTPFGLELSGRRAEAIAAWREIGCRWELALLLARGNASEKREASEIFRSLGSPVRPEDLPRRPP
jgi:DNA-binding winged helix-turn-helix (wHTH) protein/tetratricopeptide (TPR) repeat protein